MAARRFQRAAPATPGCGCFHSPLRGTREVPTTHRTAHLSPLHTLERGLANRGNPETGGKHLAQTVTVVVFSGFPRQRRAQEGTDG